MRAIDVVQVKAEIAAEKLVVIIENGSVFLKDMQSGEAVKIATLTPPNEPEYREYTCPYCYHTWLEDRDASDYPNYCPVCRAVLRDGSAPPNEALTMEELQEMDGEPVWVDTIKRWGIVRVCGYGISVLTKSGEYDVTRMKFYRRPPEGEEYT